MQRWYVGRQATLGVDRVVSQFTYPPSYSNSEIILYLNGAGDGTQGLAHARQMAFLRKLKIGKCCIS
jgi:hypothetical protein